MISVDDALAIIMQHRPDWGVESVALSHANGRSLAQDISAPFDQPRLGVSVMDGYALRKQDLHTDLTVIGESRAGHPFAGVLNAGQAIRIFTGAILPSGADYVEIQEHAQREGDQLSFPQTSTNREYIRAAGSDFSKGDILFKAGTLITPAVIMTLATANISQIDVARIPTVALLRGGDELRPVGAPLGEDSITDSIGPSLMALLSDWNIPVIDLGIVKDDPADIKALIEPCAADIIVPIGGASVGDYDYMKSVFSHLGFTSRFNKVAVKPGKPTWLSMRQNQCVLGLPGNPSSAWVCAHIFLAQLLGMKRPSQSYVLSSAIGANGNRESFLRAELTAEGLVSPLARQDSGLTRPLCQANVLIRRLAFAKEAPIGTRVDCLEINP